MKFTKRAVAVAIAGIAAAPMVASADTTLSGVIEINVFGDDVDDSDVAVGVGDINFGIGTEHELDSGLTGYGNIRIDVDRLSNAGAVDIDNDPLNEEDDVTIGSAGTADSIFVGIKGGFGNFRLGEIPLTVEYGQVANDLFDVGAEINGGLSYTGNFGPVGLGLNYSPEGNNDGEDIYGVGVNFALGGFAFGLGFEDRANNTNASAGVSFAFAGASIAAHYWIQENGDAAIAEVVAAAADPTAVPPTEAVAAVAPADADDVQSIAVQVGYGFAGVTASVTYAILDGDRDDRGADGQFARLDLGYALGGGTLLSARVNYENDDVIDADVVSYRVQLAKSF